MASLIASALLPVLVENLLKLETGGKVEKTPNRDGSQKRIYVTRRSKTDPRPS